MLRTGVFSLLALGLLALPRTHNPPRTQAVEQIGNSLASLHDAASNADFDRYFAVFAPDAVFLGTDAAERWNLDEFKAFCKPHFDKGQGWTYTPRANSRHITLSPDGQTAWFDELLDNAKYGVCRGTGVLRNMGGDEQPWKITQYCLTIPIPNAVAPEVVGIIRKHDQPGKHSN